MKSLVCAWLASVCVLAAGAGKAPLAGEAPRNRYKFTQVEMGVPFTIVLYAADETAANIASQAAFGRIAELNAVMSDYDSDSELMRLCRTASSGKAVEVSDDLFAVLLRAQDLSGRTDGAFDVTVGPVVKLWRRARRRKRLPRDDRLAAARKAVGYRHVRLDPQRQTVTLGRPGMRLDLGAIAKGYAADAALAVLRDRGITRAMVDGGGDIAVGDPPPDAPGWRIGVAPLESPDGPPSRFLSLANAAAATSGDAWQYLEIDGVRYSHILDPRTGIGLTSRSSVTVVARDCTTADSLASAVSVLGPERGLKLVEETERAAALVMRAAEGGIETFESHRLAEFEFAAPATDKESTGRPD